MDSLERAKESLPKGLTILSSRLSGAELGVFTLTALKEGVCFGPYISSDVKGSERSKVSLKDVQRKEQLPESNLQRPIWLRYVNCAPTEDRANLAPLYNNGALYYSPCKALEAIEELLVWCSGVSTVPKSVATKAKTKPSFACSVCSKAFPKSSSVKKHMTAHTKQKPYRCTDCGERFGAANSLKHHRRLHSPSDMSYKCPLCDEGFGHIRNLKNHVRIHRPSKRFPCDVCGRQFSSLSYSKRHELRHHGKR